MLVTSILLLIFVLVAAIAELFLLLLHHNRPIAILRLNLLYNFALLIAMQMLKITDVGRPTYSTCLYTKFMKWMYETVAFFILQSTCAMAIGLHVNSCSSPPF